MLSTLAGVEELAEHTGDPRWVVVDCRHALSDFAAGRRLYEAGHIPGAFFASVEDELSGARTGRNGRHPMPGADAFAKLLRDFGVNEDTQIVAYDAGADMFAARFWFLARYIGHDATAVLDGGYTAWTQADLPVSRDVPQRAGEGNVRAHVREHLTVDAEAVLRALDSQEFALLDARGADRFAGENETIDPVGGHIPGARNRPFRQNFHESGRFKSAEQLRQEFSRLGIAPEQFVHQCGSGVSATVNMLALEIAGLPSGRVYPGSWSEWCADASRPVETGS